MDIKKNVLVILLLISNLNYSQTKEIKKITLDVENYDENTIQLGYYYGDKQYVMSDALTDVDILTKQSNGKFVFHYEDSMKSGIYLVLLKPDNDYAQLLIPENISDDLKISLDARDPRGSIQVRGDDGENILFYNYLKVFNEKLVMSQNIQKDDHEALKKLDDEVRAFQKKYVEKYKNRLAANIVNTSIPIDVPKFEGSEKEVQLKSWKYLKQHYFDNIDLSNPAMLRTGFLYNMVDYYIQKLTIQHPDSISKSIDFVLNAMKPANETYKYYLISFLNIYAKSKIVGMDAVYFHLVNNYYANGDAPWVSKEQLDKIMSNAKALEPILIGKKAPDLRLEKANGTTFNLHSLKSTYTILFFWSENCKNCLKEISNVKKDEASLKKLGVEIVSICGTDNETYFQEFTKTNTDMSHWINTKITSTKAQDFNRYNINSFPQFFVLDQDKKIVSKRIGANQLLTVMNLFQN